MKKASMGMTAGSAPGLREVLAEAEALVLVDVARAQRLLEQALRLSREQQDAACEALAQCLLGNTLFFTSHYAEAEVQFRLAIATAQASADGATAVQARALSGLGITANVLGDYGAAMEFFLDSLRLAQEHGDEIGRARVLSNIGVLHAELGDHQLALDAHLECVRLGEALNNAVTHSSATVNVIVDYHHLGEHERALTLAAEYLPLVRARSLRQHEVVMQTYVVMSLLELGRHAEAAALAAEAAPLAQEVQDHEYITMLGLGLGRAAWHLGDEAQALSQLQGALQAAQERDLKVLERDTLHHLAQMHAAQGNWQLAYGYAQAHHALERTLHAQDVDRKTKVLGAQMQVELLRREAEVERVRSAELAQANTALQAMQDQLAYRATHDALTGLANRAHFQAELERALLGVEQAPFGVLFIDLDRFKQVNDTLGHDVGDDLLREVARRLQRVVRRSDLVARMGGDEFTIILSELRGAPDAERVAHKILNCLSRPFEVAGHQLHITGSIGVAVAPLDGLDALTLQKHADIAMYRAKHAGKNGVQAFQPAMGDETAQRGDVERDLREALTRQEFALHYQGQFDVQSQALVGFEALVRWQHPTRGLLAPGTFIGVAEESELIVPLGQWVLREACQQAALWDANSRGFTVSVNVSAVQFDQPDFSDGVQDALNISGLRPECLILELTESVVLRQPEEAAKQLARLRELGVRIALDDFGTGHSSLSLLRRMPIDFLKIDRSFVQDDSPAEDGSARVLIGVMVRLAHELNMQVTAEGVETSDQHELLRTLGCDAVQGYLLARPLPAAQAAALLTASAARAS